MFATLDIRPGDRRPLFLGFALLTALTAGHAVLETARDALFLSRLPAAALPWAYFGIAGLSLLVMRLTWRPGGRARRRRSFLLLILGVAAATTGMWGLAYVPSPVVPILIYVWTGLVATTLLPRFWLALSEAVTPGQARRLYALVGAGALVGATLGSLAAGFLLDWLSPRKLILVGAVMIGAAALLAPLVGGAQRVKPQRGPRQQPLARSRQLLANQPYLRRLLVLSLAMMATVTVIDYVFKSQVAAHMPAKDLGRFFAHTYAALNGIALVVQFAIAPLLLRKLGAVASLVVLPVLCAAGAVIFIATGRMWPILGAKIADGALRNSLARAGGELLLLPVPRPQRERWKPLIEALGTRGGQAVASLLLLIVVAIGFGLPLVAGVAVAFAAVWVWAALDLHPRYVELFRGAVRLGERSVLADIPTDVQAIETLVAHLSSADDAQVVAAMELLAGADKVALIPTPMILHPAADVKRAALDILARDGKRSATLGRVAERLIGHHDAEVRALSLAVRALGGGNDAELERALADRDSVVRSTAAVCLLRGERDHPGAWSAAGAALAGSPDEQVELARAAADHGDPPLLRRFLDKVSNPPPAVLREVARAACRLPSPALLPRLCAMLAFREPRAEARRAILAIGPAALAGLDEALFAEATPPAVRLHLPRTICLFDSEPAAAILTRRLQAEEDGVQRFKLLRALGRLRADQPDLPIDEAPLFAHAERTLARAFKVVAWRLAIADSQNLPDQDLLVALLTEKERHTRERLFRILGLLYPRDELRAIHGGLEKADGRRDACVEILAAVLSGPLRRRVLNLVDDLPDLERLRRAGLEVAAPAVALAEMAADHSLALRTLAAHAVRPRRPSSERSAEPVALRREIA